MTKKKEKIEETALDTQHQLEAEGAEAGQILVLVKDFQITDQESMDFANEGLADVKAKIKWLETKRKEATSPMLQALEAVRSWFRPAEKFYGEAEKIWKSKMSAYAQVQDRAQAKALAEVQAAHQSCDVEEVAQAMTQAVKADVVLPSNISITKRWRHNVVAPDLVPRNMCSPDPRKIQAAVDASEGAVAIPGVAIFPDDVVTQRSRNGA